MLEKLHDPKFRSRARPDKDVAKAVARLPDGSVVAQIGVGLGATSLKIAEILANKGVLHIFDRDELANDLFDDLIKLGHNNVVCHPSSSKAWDSYHWPLAKMIGRGQKEVFDLVYLDGAHTYLHDGLAFFLCDRLLKVGGIIMFDDYSWKFEASTAKTKFPNMTEEQLGVPQVKMVVDDLVEHHVAYEQVVRTKSYRKVRSVWRD